MPLKSVQYVPKYCEEAKADMLANGRNTVTRWDSSHDLSVIDSAGKRHRIGQFQSADLASAVGKLIEQHGLDGIT